MALPQNTYVHMETMEVTENEKEKSAQTWNTRILCMYHSQQSQGLLVRIWNGSGEPRPIKRKTDKEWLL